MYMIMIPAISAGVSPGSFPWSEVNGAHVWSHIWPLARLYNDNSVPSPLMSERMADITNDTQDAQREFGLTMPNGPKSALRGNEPFDRWQEGENGVIRTKERKKKWSKKERRNKYTWGNNENE